MRAFWPSARSESIPSTSTPAIVLGRRFTADVETFCRPRMPNKAVRQTDPGQSCGELSLRQKLVPEHGE